jgi:hypothetical protein
MSEWAKRRKGEAARALRESEEIQGYREGSNPGLARSHNPESCSGALSGRVHVLVVPRAEALGYSVMPLRGNRHIAISPFRPFAHSPIRPFAASPCRRVAVSPCRRVAVSPCRPLAHSPIRRFADSRRFAQI